MKDRRRCTFAAEKKAKKKKRRAITREREREREVHEAYRNRRKRQANKQTEGCGNKALQVNEIEKKKLKTRTRAKKIGKMQQRKIEVTKLEGVDFRVRERNEPSDSEEVKNKGTLPRFPHNKSRGTRGTLGEEGRSFVHGER